MSPSVNVSSQEAKDDVPRNVLCPYYNTCLDKAVAKNLQKWDCLTCEHRNKKEKIDPSEAERCGNLLQRIFSETYQEDEAHSKKVNRMNVFSALTAKKWLGMIESRNPQTSN